MIIKFLPIRADTPLVLSRTGDTLTLNGEDFDFSEIPEGGTLPAEAIDSNWFSEPVERVGGMLHITLLLPHGADAPDEVRFPTPLTVVSDGPVPLPAHIEEEAEEIQ